MDDVAIERTPFTRDSSGLYESLDKMQAPLNLVEPAIEQSFLLERGQKIPFFIIISSFYSPNHIVMFDLSS